MIYMDIETGVTYLVYDVKGVTYVTEGDVVWRPDLFPFSRYFVSVRSANLEFIGEL